MKAFFGILLYLYFTFTQLISIPTVTAPIKPIDNINGGDPFVVEDNGKTFYTYTTGGNISIKQITSFEDVTVLSEKTVFSEGNNGVVRDIWAPEIHKIGDKWYIVSCALFDSSVVPRGTMPEGNVNELHDDYYRYGFVLESKTQDIMGEYEFKGLLAPDGMNNINGTYLMDNGKLYYVCSAYLGVGHQCIYITLMDNPYTINENTDGQIISKPFYSWEKKGWKVNEGPAVLYTNDDTYIVYSASGYSSGEYCLGMLTLNGDDVLRKTSWIKCPVSVFNKQPEKSLYHPGHCCFLYKDNGDIYMVYHGTDNADFFAKSRCTYISKLEFCFGFPVFK